MQVGILGMWNVEANMNKRFIKTINPDVHPPLGRVFDTVLYALVHTTANQLLTFYNHLQC